MQSGSSSYAIYNVSTLRISYYIAYWFITKGSPSPTALACWCAVRGFVNEFAALGRRQSPRDRGRVRSVCLCWTTRRRRVWVVGGGTCCGGSRAAPDRTALTRGRQQATPSLSVTASGACRAEAHSAAHRLHPWQASHSLFPTRHHPRQMLPQRLRRPSTSRRCRCSPLHRCLLLPPRLVVLLRQRRSRSLPSRSALLKRPRLRSTAPNRRLVNFLPRQHGQRLARSTGTCGGKKGRTGQAGETHAAVGVGQPCPHCARAVPSGTTVGSRDSWAAVYRCGAAADGGSRAQ